MVSYVPERGDIIWLDFEPQAGFEIKKIRPALILSPKKFNLATNYAVLFPATTKIKGHSFEVNCVINNKKSAILTNQIHSFDWKSRNAKFICRCNPFILHDAIEKFMTIIQSN